MPSDREEYSQLVAATRTLLEDEIARGAEFDLPASVPVFQAEVSSGPEPEKSPRVIRSLEEIRTEIGDCTRCRLHQGRTKLVFGVGNPKAELLFVGEAPGRDEDLQGEPFVGRAGKLLTGMIEAIGLAREDVYICNVVKCRPPENRNPEPDEVATCEPFLLAQIESVKPEVICTLGKFAAASLLRLDTSISRLRGQMFHHRGIPVFPTYHPAYLLRNPAAKKDVWEDLKLVHAELCRRTNREIPRKGK